MVKIIDAEHIKSRIRTPQDSMEEKIVEAFIKFIDSEPEYENKMTWLKSKKEQNSKGCHSITYGFKCSECGCFNPVEKRYCPDCGRKFDGEIIVKNKRRNLR